MKLSSQQSPMIQQTLSVESLLPKIGSLGYLIVKRNSLYSGCQERF